MNQEFSEMFNIIHDKYNSMVVNQNGIKIMTGQYDSIKEFERVWYRNLPSEERFEVYFDEIKAISNEVNTLEYRIESTGKFGLPKNCSFSFIDRSDDQKFISLIEKYYGFRKYRKKLTSFESIKKHLIVALGTGLFTFLLYKFAEKIEALESSNYNFRRRNIMEILVNTIGQKGIAIIGFSITLTILYRAYQRINATIEIDEWQLNK